MEEASTAGGWRTSWEMVEGEEAMGSDRVSVESATLLRTAQMVTSFLSMTRFIEMMAAAGRILMTHS